MTSTIFGTLIGFVLTLFIYSYLLGDNPLYRLSAHLLVGVSVAYATVIAIRQVFWPLFIRLRDDPSDPAMLIWIVPFLLGILLLLKRHPTGSEWGNMSVALLVGVGAAVALMGAITGTLWPQATAVSNLSVNPWQNLLVALLTVSVLLTFQFTGRSEATPGVWQRPSWLNRVAAVGQVVLMMTFGVLFANILNTSLILFIERLSFYGSFIAEVFR